MRSSVRAPAPSATLLRFLKSQSQCQSQSLGIANVGTASGPRCFAQQSSRALGGQSALFTTSAASRSASGPSIAPSATPAGLDFLFPRAARHGEASIRSPRSPRRPALTSSGMNKRLAMQHQQQRFSSSETRQWLRKLLHLRKSQPRSSQKLADMPLGAFLEDSSESSMFSRAITAKAVNEPRLRCTEFDENGNVVLVNGEFKKSELIAKYGLLPRDLRKIDSSLLPLILVRESAILINLLHIRCLIKHNRVLVFDVYGSTNSYTQSVFMYDLEGKLGQKASSPSAGGLPYEFRALEAVLISVTSSLEAEFETVREPVVRVLRALEEDIDREKLRHLLVYSKKLGTFEQKAKLVRDAIDELLEADDDLASMYLTEKAHDIIRGEDDHTEVEMLLESYHKVCDEIVQASGNLVSNIRNTEEIVKAILDANRNSLMLLDLKFSIGTLGMGSGAFIAALYGMNLKNFFEESDFSFVAVSGVCTMFAMLVCIYGLTKLRRVQRFSMWGEGRGSTSRGSWRNVDEAADKREMALKIMEKRMNHLEKMKKEMTELQVKPKPKTKTGP